MIINKTRNKILAKESKVCKSLFSKTIGLMFSKKREDFGLIFHFSREQKILVHMMFVFYHIDLIFLDYNKRVVDIKKNLKPFRIYSSYKKSRYVIELPSGSARNTELKDMIQFDS